jgi:hypothetical protein
MQPLSLEANQKILRSCRSNEVFLLSTQLIFTVYLIFGFLYLITHFTDCYYPIRFALQDTKDRVNIKQQLCRLLYKTVKEERRISVPGA